MHMAVLHTRRSAEDSPADPLRPNAMQSTRAGFAMASASICSAAGMHVSTFPADDKEGRSVGTPSTTLTVWQNAATA